MKQIQYQQKAVKELVDKTIDLLTYSGMRHTLVFKAPTGAGRQDGDGIRNVAPTEC